MGPSVSFFHRLEPKVHQGNDYESRDYLKTVCLLLDSGETSGCGQEGVERTRYRRRRRRMSVRPPKVSLPKEKYSYHFGGHQQKDPQNMNFINPGVVSVDR